MFPQPVYSVRVHLSGIRTLYDPLLLVVSAERDWLQEVGFSELAQIVDEGQLITEADIEAHTQGLTPIQVKAVASRCRTLNGYIDMDPPF